MSNKRTFNKKLRCHYPTRVTLHLSVFKIRIKWKCAVTMAKSPNRSVDPACYRASYRNDAQYQKFLVVWAKCSDCGSFLLSDAKCSSSDQFTMEVCRWWHNMILCREMLGIGWAHLSYFDHAGGWTRTVHSVRSFLNWTRFHLSKCNIKE